MGNHKQPTLPPTNQVKPDPPPAPPASDQATTVVDDLRAAIDRALDPFIVDEELMPGTRAVVVAFITDQALLTLRFLCGTPSPERQDVGSGSIWNRPSWAALACQEESVGLSHDV